MDVGNDISCGTWSDRPCRLHYTQTHTTPTLSEHIRITIPALPFSVSTAWQSTIQLSLLLSVSCSLLICWFLASDTNTIQMYPYLSYLSCPFFITLWLWNESVKFRLTLNVSSALLKITLIYKCYLEKWLPLQRCSEHNARTVLHCVFSSYFFLTNISVQKQSKVRIN